MKYFAYGSNLNKIDMKKRCPNSMPIIKVILKNYRLIFNGYADIIESNGDLVNGAIYDVSTMDIKNLDFYEEYPQLYKKVDVEVEDDNGKKYKAFVYIMVKKGLKQPKQTYYETIIQGYKNWELPLEYLVNAKKQI